MRSLAITHITDDYMPVGGVPMVIEALAHSSSKLGANVRILCTSSQSLRPPDGVDLETVTPSPWARSWQWSPGLSTSLREALSEHTPMVAHVHGVWMAPNFLGVLAGRRLGLVQERQMRGAGVLRRRTRNRRQQEEGVAVARLELLRREVPRIVTEGIERSAGADRAGVELHDGGTSVFRTGSGTRRACLSGPAGSAIRPLAGPRLKSPTASRR